MYEIVTPLLRTPESAVPKQGTEDSDTGRRGQKRYFQRVQIRPKRQDQDGDETPDGVHICSKLAGAARLTAGFAVLLA